MVNHRNGEGENQDRNLNCYSILFSTPLNSMSCPLITKFERKNPAWDSEFRTRVLATPFVTAVVEAVSWD